MTTTGDGEARAARVDEAPHAEALRALAAADARMAALIARAGPCRLHPLVQHGSGLRQGGPLQEPREYFVGLVEAIVSQQLSPKAAETIFGRVIALGPGGQLPDPGGLLAIPEEALRGAGLSGAKARSVRDLAQKVAEGALRLDALSALDDEAVIEALCQVRGIGRWTAEMFLIFQLGRPDVLPVGDLGVQKGLVRLFSLRKLPRPERMHALMRPFRPFRSVACWYLWRLNEEPAPAKRR